MQAEMRKTYGHTIRHNQDGALGRDDACEEEDAAEGDWRRD